MFLIFELKTSLAILKNNSVFLLLIISNISNNFFVSFSDFLTKSCEKKFLITLPFYLVGGILFTII